MRRKDTRKQQRATRDRTYTTVVDRQLPRYDADYDLTILGRVYFALDTQAAQVKVGLTGNVTRRLASLSRERGRPLELLGTLRGGYDLERCLHRRFAPWRAEAREWYSTEILPLVLDLLVQDRRAA